jgi:hypothetical protein
MSGTLAIITALAVLGVSMVLPFVFYKLGYRHGALDRDVTIHEAYELGRKSGDNWWMGIEAEIEAERRKMWEKEKGKKRA